MLPYRKEDSFYRRDYPLYNWFTRRGYILVKVDIRGTGSSEGRLPPREYSDEEMSDAVDVIAQVAKMPGASGVVGMWGKSWGGFNSIQVAMQHPPALKAIMALYASDDLYHDDIHYIEMGSSTSIPMPCRSIMRTDCRPRPITALTRRTSPIASTRGPGCSRISSTRWTTTGGAANRCASISTS